MEEIQIEGVKTESRSRTSLYILSIIAISFCLRSPLTAVGPLVGEIGANLKISSSIMGLVTTLPVLTFGLFSPLVGKLSIRYGVPNTVFAGLIAVAAGGVMRSYLGTVGLFVGTTLVAMGIAVGNVLIPSIIKQRFPGRVGILTSCYTTTMGIFAALGAGISVPLSDGLGLGWKAALVLWAAVDCIALFLWIPQLKEGRQKNAVSSGSNHGEHGGQRVDLPKRVEGGMLRSKKAWCITLFMGLQSLLFYSVTSWMPTIVQSQGLSRQTAGTMALLFQLVGIPFTFLTPIVTEKLKRQELLIGLMGMCYFIGLSLMLTADGAILPVTIAMCLMSFSACATFAWTMASIGLSAGSGQEAAELSSMVQSGGYLLAAAGPAFSGVIFDLTGSWSCTLMFYFAAAIGMMICGLLAVQVKKL